jgi:hypothetical protein
MQHGYLELKLSWELFQKVRKRYPNPNETA